ncbi:MAG: hypothetical protein ACRCTZ_03005 [Sarcina sp.]
MDIIKGLGIGYKEDIISNLIVQAINESKVFRKSFLENLLKIKDSERYTINARARVRTREGVPDIIIKLVHDGEIIIVIIENKLSASEGFEQTENYRKDECFAKVCSCEDIKVNKELVRAENRKYVFLTLLEEQAKGKDFVNITYKDLLEQVNFDVEDISMKIVLDSFKNFLDEFYKKSNVNLNDKVSAVMQKGIDKVVLQARAKKIFEHMKLNREVYEIDKLKFDSKSAKNVGLQIYKDMWLHEKMNKDGSNLSKSTFGIHFEPIFNVVGCNFSGLTLHYEINPYYKKDKIEGLVGKESEGLNQYNKSREKFKDVLHEKIKSKKYKNIKLSHSWLQVLNIKIDIKDMTVKEFLGVLEDYIVKISEDVDEALKEING